jgi:hypothetical protein
VKIVTSASTVTRRAAWVTVFLAAISACGLGLGGESLEGDGDDAATAPSDGDGGSDGRSARQVGSPVSRDAAGNDLDAGEPGDDADESSVAPPGSGADADPPAEAGAGPADAAATCSALSVCCPFLSLIGSTSLLTACMSTVASDDPSSCQTFISGFQSFGLCL